MTALLEKRCVKCGVVKSIAEFYKRSDRSCGLKSACKKCHDQAVIKHRKINPVMAQTAGMIRDARRRAKEKNLPFDIDRDYVRSIVPSHCPIFGVKLEWSAQRGNNRKALPNSPSIDRIDPTKGYTKNNIWIISYRANAIKNDASHEELKLVTEAVGRAIVDSLEW